MYRQWYDMTANGEAALRALLAEHPEYIEGIRKRVAELRQLQARAPGRCAVSAKQLPYLERILREYELT